VSGSELRRQIEESGGIATTYDLMQRWGLSKTRLYALMQMDGFPSPLAVVGARKQPIYLVAEADVFREAQKHRPPHRPRGEEE
jgi:hypothetical protein